MNIKKLILPFGLILSTELAQAASLPSFQCTDEEGVPLSISVVSSNPRMGFLAIGSQGRGAFQSHYRGEYLDGGNLIQFFLETERTAENQYSQLYVRMETDFSKGTADGSYKATGPFGDERFSDISCQINWPPNIAGWALMRSAWPILQV